MFIKKITSFNSAFVSLSQVRDIFHGVNDQTNIFPVALMLSMTPTFIYLDKAGLIHSIATFHVHLPNTVKPKNGENSRCD